MGVLCSANSFGYIFVSLPRVVIMVTKLNYYIQGYDNTTQKIEPTLKKIIAGNDRIAGRNW